jgi:hypothetical protein
MPIAETAAPAEQTYPGIPRKALTMMNSVGWVGGKFKDLRVCFHEHPILESPLRFEQRTDKEPSQGLTPVTSSEIPYPVAAPL